MGTSLLNDYGYALALVRDLIAAGQTLFLQSHAEPPAPQVGPPATAAATA